MERARIWKTGERRAITEPSHYLVLSCGADNELSLADYRMRSHRQEIIDVGEKLSFVPLANMMRVLRWAHIRRSAYCVAFGGANDCPAGLRLLDETKERVWIDQMFDDVRGDYQVWWKFEGGIPI